MVITTGSAGPTSTWTVDNIAKTIVFSGYGPVYIKDIEYLTPSGVPANPFAGVICDVTFSDDITEIVTKQNDNLHIIYAKSVKFPANLKVLPGDMFATNYWPTEIVIPENVEELGVRSLASRHVTSVTLPPNLKIIGDYAFANGGITSIEIPNTVTHIGDHAFRSSYLTSVVIPESVRHIGADAFSMCSQLEEVTINAKNVDMSQQVFSLSGIRRLVFAPGTTYVPARICRLAHSLKSVVLPDACSRIGANAFEDCSELEDVEWPTSLEVIEESAFLRCVKLKNVNLGDNLKKVERDAFANCTSLTTVYLGENLMEIGDSAFDCRALKTVYDFSPYLDVRRASETNGRVALYADRVIRPGTFLVEAHFEGIETPTYVESNTDPVRIPLPAIVDEGKEGKWVLGRDSYDSGSFAEIRYEEKLARAGVTKVINFTKTLRDLTATVEFDSNGGRGGPGDITVTVPVGQTTARITLPSVTPVRDGYLFGGWTLGSSSVSTSNTVEVPAGQTVRLLALWRENKLPFSAQGELITPYCGIRIWKSPTVHFNATFYQDASGLAVISKAENRPGSARFTLKNEYDVPGKSLLTSSFSQWSDGSTGPIEAGMYVELLDIRTPTDAVLLMDGVISTITPEGEVVSFEVADLISLAGKSGTFLRRNFRGAGTFEQGFEDMTETSDHRLVRTFSDRTVLEAKVLNDGEWKSFPTLTKDHWEPRTSKGKVIVEGITASSTELRVRRVKIRWEHYYQQRTNQTNYQQRKLTFNVRVENGGVFSAVDIVNTPKGTVSNNQYKGMREVIVQIPVNTPCNGKAVKFEITVDQNFPEGYTYGEHDLFQPVDPNREGTQIREVSVQMDVASDVTPSTTITIESPTEEQRNDPSKRLWVSYITSGATTNPVAIMRDLAAAMGWGWESGVSEADAPSLALFRVGGSYLQDYLQKLADVVGNDGRRLSYEVMGMSANLRVGRRWSVKDSPLLTIAYGGDEESVPGAVYFHSCKVGRTFKNRPNTITVRGSISDEPSVQSVTLTIENPASRKHRGFRLDSLASDTNAIGLAGLGQMAYSTLTSSELDRWEGTVVIPGIVPVMSEGDIGHAGSGWPIRLVDSRIGLDEVVCVKQADYDYSACVTRITVGNYSSVYSNAVSSANALAVSAMDASSAVADTSLYYKQSVYLVEDSVWSPRTGVKASAYSKSRGWIDLAVPTILRLPKEEGSTEEWALVVINTVADATNNARTDYDLTRIGLPTAGGRKEIPIPSRREPDFFLGQNLTVSVMVRLA